MKKSLLTLFLALMAVALLTPDAEAKRLGGGRSTGMQRQSVAPKPATPPSGAQQAAPATPTAAPAPAPKRNWMGPLAGLAAGIGLAALFSHLGLGAGMANFVMILLLVLAAFFVLRLIFRRPASDSTAEPAQLAGVGCPHIAPIPPTDTSGMTSKLANGPAAGPVHVASVPDDFDVEAFVRVAKVQFIRMQAAHDSGNIEDIREFTTPEMFAEIKLDIDDRKGAAQTTEVVSVDAEVLEVVSESTRHVASVRFRGQIREEIGGPATAFDEVWNLVKPLQGGGWILAGVQQLN